jgi:hypothetical protein
MQYESFWPARIGPAELVAGHDRAGPAEHGACVVTLVAVDPSGPFVRRDGRVSGARHSEAGQVVKSRAGCDRAWGDSCPPVGQYGVRQQATRAHTHFRPASTSTPCHRVSEAIMFSPPGRYPRACGQADPQTTDRPAEAVPSPVLGQPARRRTPPDRLSTTGTRGSLYAARARSSCAAGWARRGSARACQPARSVGNAARIHAADQPAPADCRLCSPAQDSSSAPGEMRTTWRPAISADSPVPAVVAGRPPATAVWLPLPLPTVVEGGGSGEPVGERSPHLLGAGSGVFGPHDRGLGVGGPRLRARRACPTEAGRW